jgi:hypothetical protein
MNEKSLQQQLAEYARQPKTIPKLRAVVTDARAVGEIDANEAARMTAQIDAAEARGNSSRRGAGA